MTVSTETIRFVVGVIGNIISFGLFISPCPTFWRIIKKRSVEEFHPYPYLLASLNCMFWIFYGLPIIHPDSTLVVTINSVGLALEIIYLTIFFLFTNRKYRMIIILAFAAELALLGATAAAVLVRVHTHKARSNVVGALCVLFGILMYGSPLSIIKQVYQTKSAEFLPFWLCLAGFLNGVVWLTYALLKFDPYILTGNSTGAVLGLIQLAVYCYYTYIYRGGPRPPSGAQVKQIEVQLQQTVSNKCAV